MDSSFSTRKNITALFEFQSVLKTYQLQKLLFILSELLMANLVDGKGLFSFILPCHQLIYTYTQLSHTAVILQTI